jgi:hypothetical protein
VAEKVTVPLRFPLAAGLKMMRTVQDAPAAKVVTPDTQSPPEPPWMVNSPLVAVRVTGPLVCSPVFVMAKVSGLLDEPGGTGLKVRLVMPPLLRLAGARPIPDTVTLPIPPGDAE